MGDADVASRDPSSPLALLRRAIGSVSRHPSSSANGKPLVASSQGCPLAEDGGFEPPRVLSQHDFQSCALGHYANPPTEEITRAAHTDEIAGRGTSLPARRGGCRSCGDIAPQSSKPPRVGTSAAATIWEGAPAAAYTGRRHPVWWYLTELPQGRNAARAGELFQVRGVSSFPPQATGARQCWCASASSCVPHLPPQPPAPQPPPPQAPAASCSDSPRAPPPQPQLPPQPPPAAGSGRLPWSSHA